ncbi:MAG: 2-phospho-L-lactate transferase [Pseudonocardiales bacterium]|nr:2-phospho-L-lactate transferase [Pseudonocardiales bacterium]
MRITVLAGGVGGAKYLRGVRQFATSAGRADEVTAVINTGDDVTMHGLRICPDLDSVMYTLGGVIDTERGWGRAGETWRIKESLADYGAEPTWFGLGDLDIATHLMRTQMLDSGYPLSDVTAALCQRWQPGVRLLPMTDQRCETHVVVELDGTRRAIHFQEWWVRYRAGIPAHSFVQVGLDSATAAPGVLEAITDADLVLIAPSNPVVSIGTILAVPGVRPALRGTAAPVIGLSPILSGAPVRGMADACLPVIGVEVSAEGVGRFYGARKDDGILDGWLIHQTDPADIPGVSVLSRNILMTDDDATAAMVAEAVELAGR